MTAILVKDALEHDHHELYESWGVSPNEAARSLHFAELASLPAWDAEVLAEAAGAASDGELAQLRRHLAESTRDIEKQMWANRLFNQEVADKQLIRRLRLGLLSEKLAEIVTPGEGVLFLRRIGIEVDFELLEAVATMTMRACTDDSMTLYRALMRLPPRGNTSQPDEEPPVETVAPSEQSPRERRAAIDPASKRGAPRRILEEWDVIEKEYGPNPDAHQVLRVLSRNKDEKTPDKKTVQNIMGEFRKQGLIP
jgi:hypothetical protein